MAKAESLGKQSLVRDGTGTSLKDYTSLLGVVAAGILGMSLLCITSAIALSAPNPPTQIVLEAGNIVDLAVNNINTVSALTVQALETISIENTPILLPSRTPTSSPTVTSAVIVPPTQRQPTKTREPRIPSTSTPKPPPTRTSIPPTRTAVPSTNTSIPPTVTVTPIPDTPTPEPPTPVPDTPTNVPDTEVPTDIPTDVPTEPPPTNPPIVPIVDGSPTSGP